MGQRNSLGAWWTGAAVLLLPSVALAGHIDMPTSGHRVIVDGSSLSVLASSVFMVDGNKVRVLRAKIVVNGEARPIPGAAEISIVVKGGVLTVAVDGRPL